VSRSGELACAVRTTAGIRHPLQNRFKLHGWSVYDIDYYVQQLPSYALLDLRLGLTGRVPWTTYLYVDHLTSKIAALSVDTHSCSSPVPAPQRAVVNRPRTIGLELNYKF
jgi:hypothetical protein